jgi:serine---pyruvate transaminase
MKKNLLLTPGPTHIPPELCAVLGKPIIHHRTPQFQDNIKEVIDGLKYVYQTKNDIVLMCSSGTGAMESAVCNLLSAGDEAIVVDGGKFGERWTELCEAYGVKAHVIKVEWGHSVKPELVQKALNEHKAVKAVFVTLSETSTGVSTDVKAVADIVHKTPAVLVVDAVSGLGIIDIQTDNWNVDVVVSASHKGFMLPPGVSFASVSAKAWKLVDQAKSPRYYFDYRKARKALEQVDTPFTPAIGIVIALAESLRYMKKEGLENLFKRYARLARGTRAAAVGLGLKVFADEKCVSNVLTPILLPESINGEKLVKTMRDTYGVSIAGGQDQLKGKIVRIAHMGALDEYDILAGIACFEKVLKEMGYKFTLGAGLSAAQKVFNE